MKSNLSMTEFQKLCQKAEPVVFIYDTENQSNSSNHIKVVQKYSEVIFMLNPNEICFKNEFGTLCFGRVKSIEHHDNSQMVGDVFSIICGNTYNSDEDVSYTILVDSKMSKL